MLVFCSPPPGLFRLPLPAYLTSFLPPRPTLHMSLHASSFLLQANGELRSGNHSFKKQKYVQQAKSASKRWAFLRNAVTSMPTVDFQGKHTAAAVFSGLWFHVWLQMRSNGFNNQARALIHRKQHMLSIQKNMQLSYRQPSFF